MKKLISFFTLSLCLFFMAMSASAQNVTVNPGAGSYPTLKDAFDAINAGTHTGAVTVDILMSTAEPVRARLNASGTGSASYTSVVITTSNAGGVTVAGSDSMTIALMGADDVTLDGRIGGAGRFISVTNSATFISSCAIWVSHGNGTTTDSAGAMRNVIRNCNVSAGVAQSTATTSTFGIVFSGHNRTFNGRNNDNNKVLENFVTKARVGIMFNGGSSANTNDDNEISANLVGPAAFGTDQIGIYGISVQFQNRVMISNNEVRFVGGTFGTTTGGGDRIGINLGNVGWSNTSTSTTTNSNCQVLGNMVHDVIEERTFSAVGILIGTTLSGPKTNNLIANNVVYNVRSNGTVGDACAGIAHVGGPGDRVIFNSVSITGDLDPAGTSTASSSPVCTGIRKHSAAAGADTAVLISDNSSYVDASSNTTTLLKVCITGPVATYLWGTGGLNNNDYFSPSLGVNGHVTGTAGTGTTSFATLALWQAVYTPAQDAASIQCDPLYSAVPPLKPFSGSCLVGAGAPKSPISTDIEGNTRSGTTPTIGAYETTVAPILDDVGVTAAVIGTSPIQIISVGKGYDLTATVKNFGQNPQTIVPVYYDVNGGSAVGPVNTVGPIPQNGTENVLFTGGFAFTPAVSGINTVRIWTALASDQHPVANDTLTLIVNVQQKIAAYPYIQTFTAPINWTVVIENAVGTTAMWGLGICTNTNGNNPDTAATSNCFNASAGRVEILRSPEMDLTGMTNPVLNFYCAYRTYTGGESDSLQVLVSTDGGVTYFSASTVYDKGANSTPSLATLVPSSSAYFPANASEWRHETVSLANVAGNSNVVIGFRSTSDFGNRQWVDNVIVANGDLYCTDAVTAPGMYNCNSTLALNFGAIGLRPNISGNQSMIKATKQPDNSTPVGSFKTLTGELNVEINNQTDNPSGGVASVTQYNNDATVMGQGVATNTTETNPGGQTFTPNAVYQDYWFTVTYTGNDYLGVATFDVRISLNNSIIFSDPFGLYIVKRTDRTGLWRCLTTTLSATNDTLIASGLTGMNFCDFALAGDSTINPLPVELASFTSSINRRDVTLNWTTSTESNNAGFDIERSVNGQWSKIGNVNGNGTTSTPHSYSFTDRGLNSGKYNYRLKQIDFNGNYSYYNLSNEVNVGTPSKFDLSQNYPNPFNPSTKINYDLPFDGKVSIKVYDMSGKEVSTIVNDIKTAGYHTVDFNAASLSSGVYFYRISVDGNGQNFVATKKMMLIK